MKVKPIVSEELSFLLDKKEKLFELAKLHDGPINLMFPLVIQNNIEQLKEVFNNLDLDYEIYFAHKPTKSKAIIKQVEASGVCIDVASRGELVSALSSGFTGDRIEATGPKDIDFLSLALKHGVLISIDSLSELQTIIKLKKEMRIEQVKILVRFSTLSTSDRVIQERPSRFGIDPSSLSEVLDLIKEHNIELKGFHFHKDGYDMESKAGFIENILDFVEVAFKRGFAPEIINIGGGWRTCVLEDKKDWSDFIDVMSEQVLDMNIKDYWGKDPYGLKMNQRGKIDGRSRAEQRIYYGDYKKDLIELFGNDSLKGRPLADILMESMQKVIIEPGFVLLQNAGCTILKIIGIKKTGGKNIIVTNSNIYNLSVAKLFEYVTDPILVSSSEKKGKFEAFIAGNLCVEDDMIIKRKIYFDHEPQPGDLLVLSNTAPYYMDFESGNPIQQAGPKRFAAVLKDDKMEFFADKVYNPYL